MNAAYAVLVALAVPAAIVVVGLLFYGYVTLRYLLRNEPPPPAPPRLEDLLERGRE